MRMAAFWPTRSPTGEVVKVGFGSRAAVHEGKATSGHHQQAEITPTPLYAVWSGKERWYTYDGIKLLDEPAGTTGRR
jgi:hypothetical protein